MQMLQVVDGMQGLQRGRLKCGHSLRAVCCEMAEVSSFVVGVERHMA
jgi:hypothetical protein